MHLSFSNFRTCASKLDLNGFKDSVLLENINITLKYEDIDFKFDNLGTFANTALNSKKNV